MSLTPELDPVPHIYVASLADYVAGKLHGEWINATQSPDQMATQITNMLARSPIPNAEEWAIHDYEHFGGHHLDPHESLQRVWDLAAKASAYSKPPKSRSCRSQE